MLNPINVLLVEDSETDIGLTTEALRDSKLKLRLAVVRNGEEAMAYLLRQGKFSDEPMPNLILLDLNLPRKSGREVLAEIRANPRFTHLPVIVLTASPAEEDIMQSYRLHANCYIRKPVGFEEFMKVVRSVENFWFTIVEIPKGVE